MALLEEHRHLLTSFDPEEKECWAFRRVSCPMGRPWLRAPGLVKEIVARFSKAVRAAPALEDYLYLRMAEGMVAMSEEDTERGDSAISILYWVWTRKLPTRNWSQSPISGKAAACA